MTRSGSASGSPTTTWPPSRASAATPTDFTRFGGRIVHGTLVSGLISAALARLPGLTIYLSQDLEFLKPVEIGDRLTAVVEIVEDIGNGRYRLTTSVENEDAEPVIDGEAVVIIDEPPSADD